MTKTNINNNNNVSSWAKDLEDSSEDIKIRALQVLLPYDILRSDIIEIYTLAKDPDYFQSLVNQFVFDTRNPGRGMNISRSLYFLDFPDPFMYASYNKATVNERGKELVPTEKGIVNVERHIKKRLSDRKLLKTYWTEWIKVFRNAKYGCSTYWTNISLNIDSDELLVSAYLILENKINKENQYKIYKYLSKTLHDFAALLYKKEIDDRIIKSAISKISNRNYAHHIGSHVSHRATIDKISRRIGKPDLKTLSREEFASIADMESRLVRFKDQRNDFIAGLDSNNHPVKLRFYRDIILPFIENNLIMDNIAAGEGVSFSPKTEVTPDDSSRLRIRVFYHRKIITPSIKKSVNNSENTRCGCTRKNSGQNKKFISLSELGINDDYLEICSEYKINDHFICIHELPYLKFIKYNSGLFYEEKRINIDDIEILVPGTLGAHSIYSIIENHIRNTVKHANQELLKKAEKVDIIIKINEGRNSKNTDSQYYNIELSTNIPTFRSGTGSRKVENRFYNLKNDSREPITYNLKSLGLADIRVNANKLAFCDINQNNLRDCLDLDYLPKKGARTDLQYPYALNFKFRLTKPKNIAFIGKFFKIQQGRNLTGTRYFNNLDDNVLLYDFVWIDAEIILSSENNFLKNWYHYLPRKTFIFGKVNRLKNNPIYANRFILKENIPAGFEDITEFLEYAWESWIRKWTEKGIYLSVVCDTDSNGIPVNTLKDPPDRCSIFTSPENASSFIYYLRHSWGIKKDRKAHKYNKCNYFLEAIEKQNKDFDIITGYSAIRETEPFFQHKIIEAGLNRIAIIDERITELSGNCMPPDSNPPKDIIQCGFKCYTGNDDNQIKDTLRFIDVAAAANIFIVTHFFDEEIVMKEKSELTYIMDAKDDSLQMLSNNPNYHFQYDPYDDKRNFFKDEKNKVHKPADKIEFDLLNDAAFDILIIHRTYLKKLFERGISLKQIHAKFGMIYVTTGGGSIDDIESLYKTSFKLLSIDSINELLNPTVMKYSLVQLLS